MRLFIIVFLAIAGLFLYGQSFADTASDNNNTDTSNSNYYVPPIPAGVLPTATPAASGGGAATTNTSGVDSAVAAGLASSGQAAYSVVSSLQNLELPSIPGSPSPDYGSGTLSPSQAVSSAVNSASSNFFASANYMNSAMASMMSSGGGNTSVTNASSTTSTPPIPILPPVPIMPPVSTTPPVSTVVVSSGGAATGSVSTSTTPVVEVTQGSPITPGSTTSVTVPLQGPTPGPTIPIPSGSVTSTPISGGDKGTSTSTSSTSEKPPVTQGPVAASSFGTPQGSVLTPANTANIPLSTATPGQTGGGKETSISGSVSSGVTVPLQGPTPGPTIPIPSGSVTSTPISGGDKGTSTSTSSTSEKPPVTQGPVAASSFGTPQGSVLTPANTANIPLSTATPGQTGGGKETSTSGSVSSGAGPVLIRPNITISPPIQTAGSGQATQSVGTSQAKGYVGPTKSLGGTRVDLQRSRDALRGSLPVRDQTTRTKAMEQPIDIAISRIIAPEMATLGTPVDLEIIVANDSEVEMRGCLVSVVSSDGFRDKKEISLRPKGKESARFRWTPSRAERVTINAEVRPPRGIEEKNIRNNEASSVVKVTEVRNKEAAGREGPPNKLLMPRKGGNIPDREER